jgi:dephospho-CoA kinase
MSSSNKPSLLLLITGPISSGKDSVGQYLADKHGMQHVSGGDLLRAEARLRGATDPISREVLEQTGAELAALYGQAPLTHRALEQYQDVADQYPGGLVMTGLRRLHEVHYFEEQGGIIWYVDAPLENRFEWATTRKRGDDPALFASFAERDSKELNGETPDGKDGIYILGVKALAQSVIVNDSTEQALYDTAEQLYANL